MDDFHCRGFCCCHSRERAPLLLFRSENRYFGWFWKDAGSVRYEHRYGTFRPVADSHRRSRFQNDGGGWIGSQQSCVQYLQHSHVSFDPGICGRKHFVWNHSVGIVWIVRRPSVIFEGHKMLGKEEDVPSVRPSREKLTITQGQTEAELFVQTGKKRIYLLKM